MLVLAALLLPGVPPGFVEAAEAAAPAPARIEVHFAVEMSSSKPSYNQLMALFKNDGLSFEPLSVLETTRQLVAQYYQLRSGALAGPPMPALLHGDGMVMSPLEGQDGVRPMLSEQARSENGPGDAQPASSPVHIAQL
jgi:hypothetical protein